MSNSGDETMRILGEPRQQTGAGIVSLAVMNACTGGKISGTGTLAKFGTGGRRAR